MASKLTPKAIDGLSIGEKLTDAQSPGLSIEMLPSGKRVWKYKRRVARGTTTVRLTGGTFPNTNIPTARQWAADLNAKVEAGSDPREERRADETRAAMTVARAHELYMEAVERGTASRSKRTNKPRTIADKLAIFTRDIEPTLGTTVIYDVAEAQLVKLVQAKRAAAPVRANRLVAELKVFWKWCGSLDAQGTVALDSDPTFRLHELMVEEKERTRKLSREEIGWFLCAVAAERRDDVRRAMVVMLLTGSRITNVLSARTSAIDKAGVWTIDGSDHKNGEDHIIPLGPWGRALMTGTGEFVFPAERLKDGHLPLSTLYKARTRVHAAMEKLANRSLAHWTPHDLRRTLRSNTRGLKIDFLTAEAMIGHRLPKGVERIYDTHDPLDDKRVAYALWEAEIASITRQHDVADVLEVPQPQPLPMA